MKETLKSFLGCLGATLGIIICLFLVFLGYSMFKIYTMKKAYVGKWENIRNVIREDRFGCGIEYEESIIIEFEYIAYFATFDRGKAKVVRSLSDGRQYSCESIFAWYAPDIDDHRGATIHLSFDNLERSDSLGDDSCIQCSVLERPHIFEDPDRIKYDIAIKTTNLVFVEVNEDRLLMLGKSSLMGTSEPITSSNYLSADKWMDLRYYTGEYENFYFNKLH